MGPKVHEVMTDRPRCVTPETPVAEAARLMEADDVGSLPILEGEQLTGMVTGKHAGHRRPSSREGQRPQRHAGPRGGERGPHQRPPGR